MKRAKALVAILYYWPMLLYCCPVQFSRIIIPQADGTFFTIDLIHDIHQPSRNEPSLYNNNPNETYLSDDEKKLFLPQERAFINALHQLDQTADSPINLYWECNPIDDQKMNDRFNEENVEYTSNMSDSGKLLEYYGFYFLKKGFQKHIMFVPSNIWRPNSLLNEILVYNNRKNFNYSYDIETAFQFITRHFSEDNPANELLKKVRDTHPEVYAKIQHIYDDLKNNVLEPIYAHYVQPFLNKNMSLSQVLKQIKKKDTLNSMVENVITVPGLMDIELLCKIFGSSTSHAILYAGADHCNYLLDLLERDFHGHVVTNIGMQYEHTYIEHNLHKFTNRRILEIALPQLKTSIWNFLTEPPLITWQRYTHSGMVKSIIQGDILTSIDSLKTKTSWDEIWPTLISYAKRAYVDIANAFDETHQSLLHLATLKRNPRLVQLLLDEGAYVESENLSRKTALSYAAIQKDTHIIQLLLDAGANPLHTDEQGLSPLDYAKYTQDATVIGLLQEYLNKI